MGIGMSLVRSFDMLARRKKREYRRKHPAGLPGQLTLGDVEERLFREKVSWHGGILARKNVQEENEDG